MVLGQVGEHRRGELDRVGASQLQRVRGDLHRTGAVAPVEHRPQVRLQVDRLGGGPQHLPLTAGDHRLHRAEQPAL